VTAPGTPARFVALGDITTLVKGSMTAEAGTLYELYSVPSWSTGEPEVVDGGLVGSSKRSVQPGDVLISKINPRLNRNWVVGPQRDGVKQIASPEWVAVRCSEEVLPAYLFWVAQSAAFRRHVLSAVSSVTGSHARAKPAHVLSARIPLPSLERQQVIVDTLTDRYSAVQRSRAAVERLLVQAEGVLPSLRRDLVAGRSAGTAIPGGPSRQDLVERRLAPNGSRHSSFGTTSGQTPPTSS
jgi:type I restriction enzyme S subunit